MPSGAGAHPIAYQNPEWEQPEVLNTDKAPTYAAAIAELKAEGKCPTGTRHRQVKYLNNVIEADHGKLKLLIRKHPPRTAGYPGVNLSAGCCSASRFAADRLRRPVIR